MKKIILNTVDDLVVDFIYYARKEDEVLQRGIIEAYIQSGDVTIEEIVERFSKKLHDALK